jgi:hypothetical protein
MIDATFKSFSDYRIIEAINECTLSIHILKYPELGEYIVAEPVVVSVEVVGCDIEQDCNV